MNEEEKKAVEYTENCLMKITMGIDCEFDVNILYALVNIIKKLQKENEELKLYNNSITSQLEQMTTEKFKNGWFHQSEFKDSIPVQEVKDLKDRILKNEEYTVVLEGDKEFPDSTTEATFEKYINLKVLDELIERRK